MNQFLPTLPAEYSSSPFTFWVIKILRGGRVALMHFRLSRVLSSMRLSFIFIAYCISRKLPVLFKYVYYIYDHDGDDLIYLYSAIVNVIDMSWYSLIVNNINFM